MIIVTLHFYRYFIKKTLDEKGSRKGETCIVTCVLLFYARQVLENIIVNFQTNLVITLFSFGFYILIFF